MLVSLVDFAGLIEVDPEQVRYLRRTGRIRPAACVGGRYAYDVQQVDEVREAIAALRPYGDRRRGQREVRRDG